MTRSYEFGESLDDFTKGNSRQANGAPAIAPMSGRQASVNILIVDDEPRNLTVLEAILEDPAYRLVRAESAEEALLALLVDEFALLIVDIRMPGQTGLEFAQMIKARKKTANVPIIFLTAYYSEDQQIVEGYDTGAVDYLSKPVNPAILRSKVAIFAELYRKQHNLEEVNRVLAAVV
jgi:response regulator RpfG family c-di-GMP phosphodiesterase